MQNKSTTSGVNPSGETPFVLSFLSDSSGKNIDNHADNRFSYPETAFDRIFPVASHNLMVKIYPVGGKNMVSSDLIAPMVSVIKSSSTSKCTISLSVSSNRLVLKIIPERLLVYHVPMMQLVEVI